MTKKIAPIARYIIPPILKIWTGKITGLENLPQKGGFIIAPNHCSYIEHFLIGGIVIPHLNKEIHILAKKEHYDDLHEKTWHGFWTKWVKQIPIDRGAGDEALQKAEKCLKEGNILVMYPEGTRSLTGKLGKGKTGAARLAMWADVPIIPLGIKGTFEILPKGKRFPRFKKADFNFGKPIKFEHQTSRSIDKNKLTKATDKVMQNIAELSDQEYLK